jgi:multidrug transporter EmrE-like cation transporter
MKGWIKPAVGIALIAAGVAGITYGEFTYTKEEHEAKLGGLEMSYKEKDTIDIPKWAGVGSIAVGIVLLVFGRKP